MKLNPKSSFVTHTKSYLDNCFMRKNAKLPKVLGKRLQRIRKRMKITQEQLAEKIGISTTYMGYIEQGRYAPSLEVLQKIVKALGVKMKDIFP